MTNNKLPGRAAHLVAFLGTLMLCACGGGGSSNNASNASTPSLSAAQQNYESVVLARNGGQHYVEGALSFSTSASGAVSLNSGSAFFTADSSLAQSPAAAGPQMMTTGTSTLDSALAVPTINGQRYLVNGAIVVTAVPDQIQVSYNGPNVQETTLATDGQTPVQTLLGTNYTVVPLSGTVASSPAELMTGSALSIITNSINGTSLYNQQATWQQGSAYLKATRHVVGDTVMVGDCTTPDTTGTNVTPCATTASTLSAFFPHTSPSDNKTYNLSDGQIVTLAGAQAWNSTTAINTPTTEYRVYFQLNGQIYSGVVIRDGTTLAVEPAGSTTPQDFYIFLNSAAVQSVKAALTL
jgi:hypothetical protein